MPAPSHTVATERACRDFILTYMPPKKNPRLRYCFRFNYKVTQRGVPQPYPLATPNSIIVFRFSPAEDETGAVRTVLNICGTRAGLKRLAAMLVLCADSEQYDPEFHIHLEAVKGVETDLDVTLRAPVYLDSLRKGQFREFKSTWISLHPRKSRARGRTPKRQPPNPLQDSGSPKPAPTIPTPSRS